MKAHKRIIQDNARSILKCLTRYYGCKYSDALYKIMEEHPDFPSFLSIQYILQRMGKESFALHTQYESLQTFSFPFIAHAKTNVEMFLFVRIVTEDSVCIMYENGQEKEITRIDFENMWDGNVLVIDDAKGHLCDISLKNRFDSYMDKMKRPFLIIFIMPTLLYLLLNKASDSLLFYLYFGGILSGMIVSVLLVTEQVDKYNIHIKKLCSSKGGKNQIDCSSILDFKDAYFMGLIAWSDIGFVYFSSLLLMLFFCPFEFTQTLINLLSILSIVYTCYSVYYQKYIANKWCTLCLSVQGVFVYQFLLSLSTISNIEKWKFIFDPESLFLSILLVGCNIAAYWHIKSLLITHKKYPLIKKEYDELRYDDNIIKYLFQKEKEIENINKAEGISVINYGAENNLTLIFSPVCVSCIKDLQIVLPILARKKSLNLEVVFLFNNEKYAEIRNIIYYFLEVYDKNPDKLFKVLSDYVKNYPVSKNKVLRKSKNIKTTSKYDFIIDLQREWCIKNKFTQTPILFVNGKKMPIFYKIKDLDYLY